ncbi:MAG: hypothetical protein ACRBK7_28465 [Acidimicrobiales bacterium]
MSSTGDPILEKRARISRLTSLSIRVGAGLYLLATVLFVIALLTDFTSLLASAITVALIVGSLVLAPAMVFHYAVKAANRADREGSW